LAVTAYGGYQLLSEGGGLTAAERLALNRAEGMQWEEGVASELQLTRNIGPGRVLVEGTRTARGAIPDFYEELLGEAKYSMSLRGLTPQLRVLIEASAEEGRPLNLFLPEGARIAPSIFKYAAELKTEIIPVFL
jgi:hypothetical protein